MSQNLNNQNFIIGTSPAQAAVDHLQVLLSDLAGNVPFTLAADEGLRIYKKNTNNSETLLAGGDVPTGATWRVTGMLSIDQSPPVAQDPEIELVAPSTVSPSDTLEIQGTGFSVTLLQNVVEVDGDPATVLTASPTLLTVRCPAGPAAGDVLVTVEVNAVPAVVEDPDLATVTIVGPTVDSFSPLTGPVGTPVTILGENFSTIPAENFITFGGPALATTLTASKTQLTCLVPVGAASSLISVAVGPNADFGPDVFTVT